jgi:hypothetical protein
LPQGPASGHDLGKGTAKVGAVPRLQVRAASASIGWIGADSTIPGGAGRTRAAVNATSDDAGMTIIMRRYSFTWPDLDGTPRASAVAYHEVSVDRRRGELEKAGATTSREST